MHRRPKVQEGPDIVQPVGRLVVADAVAVRVVTRQEAGHSPPIQPAAVPGARPFPISAPARRRVG